MQIIHPYANPYANPLHGLLDDVDPLRGPLYKTAFQNKA